MAQHICHQCTSVRALCRGLLRIMPTKVSEPLLLPGLVPTPRFLTTSPRSRPDQVPKVPKVSKVSKVSKEPSATPTQRIKRSSSIADAAAAAARSNPNTVPATGATGATGTTEVTEAPLDPERMEHIEATRRRIDRLVKQLEVDALYLEFWRICCTETIEDQRLIWHHQLVYPEDVRQENFYRVFNSFATPHHTSYPSDRYLVRGKRIPASMYTVRGDRSIPPTKPGIIISPKAEPTFNYHTIRFIPRSHAKRLLQIHQYFELVLNLTIGYYAKIALIVALSSRGDIITVRKLFLKWQERQPKEKRAHVAGGDGLDRSPSEAGGKEMYSAVIRGLVGRNFRNHEQRPYYIAHDHISGIRNNGVTQMHAALELFYDLLRKGGTPTFETYHSLVVGLSVFKNDMEAAELLLDHMILLKRKPYVQVLHVMCREYARRKNFAKAERIFGMLKEYGIRPRALTCNVMLQAVFRMSDTEALQHLGQADKDQETLDATTTTTTQDLEAKARQLKRHKIREIREYMRINNTAPDQETLSTLIYGYGHMEDGYPDLKGIMMEMISQQGQIEPNLVVLNSLVFAHLNHGKVKIAETILDQILSTPLSAKDREALGDRSFPQQESSPFRKSRKMVTEDEDEDEDEDKDENEGDEEEMRPKRTIYDKMMMIPGKGTFHALMLAHVERADIQGMERVLDKMIQTNKQQEDLQQQLRSQNPSRPRALRRRLPPTVDLEADEYTANIMLLGYLVQRDFEKVNMVREHIRARSDWKSSSMSKNHEENLQQMIEFVKKQSSKMTVEQFFGDSGSSTNLASTSKSSVSSSSKKAEVFDPLSGNVEEELDDDFEIDVTTLSAKLRSLTKSTSSSSSSSSSSSPPSLPPSTKCE